MAMAHGAWGLWLRLWVGRVDWMYRQQLIAGHRQQPRAARLSLWLRLWTLWTLVVASLYVHFPFSIRPGVLASTFDFARTPAPLRVGVAG